MLVAGLVAAAVGAGVAYATIPDGSGVIWSCYGKSVGTWRPIDYPTEQCRLGETLLSWNQQGPQGAQGVPGPQGPTGPSGTSQVYYASNTHVVDARALDPSEEIVGMSDLPVGKYVFTVTLHDVWGDDDAVCGLGLVSAVDVIPAYITQDAVGHNHVFNPFKVPSGHVATVTFAANVSGTSSRPDVLARCIDTPNLIGQYDPPVVEGTVTAMKVDAIN